ncbi:MAG: glycosyltransferase family 2 protein [Candidatus Magnetomorum sp.]|nr:glycosyltransferase family 2 protein [Candidatus Magnetomorum sp.]
MSSISVCIICGDDEHCIRRCLESATWADEIVVVDHCSKDNTFAIVKEFTDKAYRRPWTGFIDQKNAVLSHASCDWVFSLDSDEAITDELRKEIQELIQDVTAKEGYYVPRRTFFHGRWINNSGFYPDRQLRLFKRTCARWVGERVHERVEIDGTIGQLKFDLLHYPYKGTVEGLERTANRYSSLQAQNIHDQGKRFRLWRVLFRPFFKFLEVYVLKRGFLDGIAGFIIAINSSHSMFLRYIKLREIEKGYMLKAK